MALEQTLTPIGYQGSFNPKIPAHKDYWIKKGLVDA
jgi:hypothetical protein